MSDTKFRRNTPQRKAILEELRKATSHPTAVELYERVRGRMPKISLGTVYRNLDLLAEMGKIQKLDLAGSEARFDGNLDTHDHVRCVRCGRLDDVYGLPTGSLIHGPSQPAGYEILGHRLELLGICPRCRVRPSAARTGPPLEESESSGSAERPAGP
jgi:Fur family ferric uptake transcriptional regulator